MSINILNKYIYFFTCIDKKLIKFKSRHLHEIKSVLYLVIPVFVVHDVANILLSMQKNALLYKPQKMPKKVLTLYWICGILIQSQGIRNPNDTINMMAA